MDPGGGKWKWVVDHSEVMKNLSSNNRDDKSCLLNLFEM